MNGRTRWLIHRVRPYGCIDKYMEDIMAKRNFPRFDEQSAPDAAREELARNKRAFGVIPTPIAAYSSSPLMLRAAVQGLASLEESALSPLEREVLAMTMGRANGCDFCISLHKRMLKAQRAAATLIDALEHGSPIEDARLEALRAFVLDALERKGDVSDDVWSRFTDAGYSHAHALDVITGISVYTLTTFANRLTETSERLT